MKRACSALAAFAACALAAGCTTTAKPVDTRTIVGDWRVERITDKAVLPERAPTVQFAADGQVSGLASCNRFTGTYRVDGRKLSIGDAATTRMMCAEPVMEQEARLLGALRSVESFEFDGTALLLYSRFGLQPSRLIPNPDPGK